MTPVRREMIAALEKGGKISNLNKTSKNEYPTVVNLEKYQSKADIEEHMATQM